MVTFLEISPSTQSAEKKCDDKIYVFSQFFIHCDIVHQSEIKYCLQQNVENSCIDQIILLNERIYSNDEMGITSPKIKQINIGKRLKFSDVFDYVIKEKINGYICIINIDIFLTPNLDRLKTSDIHEKKKAFALLRYEYRGQKDLTKVPLFGARANFNTPNYDFTLIESARADSWDTWIIHTNFMITTNENKAFNFQLGQLGCDNKIIYLLKILGYEIYNDPIWIPTYHYQSSQQRNYTIKDRIKDPYGLYIPARTNVRKTPSSLGVNIPDVIEMTNKLSYLHFSNDNIRLKKYIQNKITNNKNFIIPRIAGEENNFAFIVEMINQRKIPLNEETKKYLRVHIMKNNAGIKISNFDSAIKYSKCYLKAFEHCDMYTVWENWGAVYRAIKQSHDYITSVYNSGDDQGKIWAFAFDIYHYLYNPWTWALRGKRLLIISPFEESMKKKLDIRKEIYGVDLFPDCEFVFIKPPQTQGDQESSEFDIELNAFFSQLEKLKGDFDIALCSCGGYGNLVCDYIYDKMNKSAIYVGGVLQMYFGIYGNRWIRERGDVLRIYLNKYWTRPDDSEKPKNFQKVEGSCYW